MEAAKMRDLRDSPNAVWTGSGGGPVGKFTGEASRVMATVVVLILALSPMASAQTGSVKWTLGAGVGVSPDYEGSEDYEPVPVLNARVAWQEGYFVQLGPSTLRALQLRANILPREGSALGPGNFQFGPLANYRPERDDVDNDRVDDLKKVDAAMELGAFVGYAFNLQGDPRTSLGINFQFAADVTDSHGGWLYQPAVDFRSPLGDALSFSARVFSTYASDDYMRTYFGIDSRNAARSGLETFDADAGFKDVGLNLGLTYDLIQNWQVGARASYTRLLGDAKDSPVTDDEGSANQFFAGLLINYRF